MNSVTKLPTHADRVNAAADRVRKALHETRQAAYQVGFHAGRYLREADDKAEREAASECTDALTALVELALGIKDGAR